MRQPPAWTVAALVPLTLFLLVAGGIGLDALAPSFSPSEQARRLYTLAGFAVMEGAAVLLPCWAFLAACRVSRRDVAPFSRIPTRRLLGCAVGTLGLGLAITYLQSWFLGWTHLEYPPEIAALIQVRDPLDAGLLVLAIAVIPAVAEEIFSRGYVQSALVPRLGLPLGILATSATFVILHWTPAGAPTYLVLGLWLSLLRWRTGSLVGCVLAHALNNTLAILQENLVPEPFWAAHVLWVLPLGLALTTLGAWWALGGDRRVGLA